jgi:hypothetical protein
MTDATAMAAAEERFGQAHEARGSDWEANLLLESLNF